MSRRLTTTRRQRRALRLPPPGRAGNIKVTRDGWVECARVALIEDGIGGIKVDRLAQRLKVTRGGFYYHFRSPHALLEALLESWRARNRFVPESVDASSPQAAAAALDHLADTLIHERGFDPQFDMAVREWARISHAVAEVVHRVDDERVEVLRRIFSGLGYGADEARIRARVFYYHQIGYYALDVREDAATRERNAPIYLSVLCGERYLKVARRPGG